jgi:DNA-binding FrmR family transcriptional regulator
VFDVHPPNTSIHGWREFFIHLATITIGLLIALGLEGTVEWFHHRHVMHQAQEGLLKEIKFNADGIHGKIAGLEKHQEELKRDVEILKQIIAHPDVANHETLTVALDLTGFDSVSWATAQATGATTYMAYAVARRYSDIYSEQAEIDAQVRQAMRDFSVTVGPLLNAKSGDRSMEPEDAKVMKQRIETLQGQLYLVNSLMHTMENSYRSFLEVQSK